MLITNLFEKTQMEQLQQLMKQRDDLEAEIEAITGSLNSSGTPGMHGGLVDKDGFPISDVEKILSVRELRSLLISTSLLSFLLFELFYELISLFV
jgi:hypothetical protein